MSRRIPGRAWRILRPGHTRRARLGRAQPPPADVIRHWRVSTIDPDLVVDDWPGPDLSPCTAELLDEDEIRREIEAKRRRHG